MRQIRIALVGLGGYAGSYVSLLTQPGLDAVFCAVIDPYARQAAAYAQIAGLGIPVYDTLQQFYEKQQAELVIISTPVHLHYAQAMAAMQNGSHVLCEKPLAPTLQQAQSLNLAAQQMGRILAVGFQWSFSQPILSLKRDIMRGDFGRPILFKAMVAPSRARSYYRGWQGHLQSPQGEWLLDSIATNAASHSLHNLLFLLGAGLDTTAQLLQGKASLYRANSIQGFDTCFVGAQTDRGATIGLYASHAVQQELAPRFELIFEHARVVYRPQNPQDQITAFLKTGQTRLYGDPQAQQQRDQKLYSTLQAIKQGSPVPCAAHTALAQIRACNALFDQVPIHTIDQSHCRVDAQRDLVYVPGMEQLLLRCQQQGTLPGADAQAWTVAETSFTLQGYQQFSGKLLEVQG